LSVAGGEADVVVTGSEETKLAGAKVSGGPMRKRITLEWR